MPAPSRDRLPRPVDISTLFPGAAQHVHLIVDEPGLRWAGLSGNPTRNVAGGRGGVQPVERNRGGLVTPARHGARRTGSELPHWYPRTPLRDITGIIRAIEGRRAELQQADDPFPENFTTNMGSVSGFDPEQHNEVFASTPVPSILMKPPHASPSTQAREIMGENQENGNLLTPEKRLLNSIDKVSEVWLKERRRLERTPAAKKAQRETKLRTLMTMR